MPKSATAVFATLGFSWLLLHAASTCWGSDDGRLSIDIGLQKQLLVDDYSLAEMHNVRRELGTVKKCGVVLKPSLPTDFVERDGKRIAVHMALYLTSVRNEEDDKFQMWYLSTNDNGVAYAESRDGIHWEKPLVSKDGKSNIVLDAIEFGCTIDPTVPWGASDKYKIACRPVGTAGDDCAVHLAYSADGIQWTWYNNRRRVTHRAADTHSQILWDPLRHQYRLTTRTDGARRGEPEYRTVRIMYHDRGNDLLRYPAAWKTVKDRIVIDDPADEGYPGSSTQKRQFHHITCWFYEGIYFGIMNVLETPNPTGKTHAGGDFETRFEEDVAEYYIGTSRDGLNFDKSWVHARKPFVPRGPPGSFDKDNVTPSSQIITHNDEHWIYYCGMNERFFVSGLRQSRVGLAKLRLDGFVCLTANDDPGFVVTRPFVLQGDALEVNVDAVRGSIAVEVLDESGRPISGFSKSEAILYRGENQLRLRPRWVDQPDLSLLRGRVARLKFYLRNAKLYAFQVVR